jgi:acyl-CoA synthetase (AMP-forming)/AMP-acid ligase II
MCSNRPEFVVAVRAIWQLGASVVLLSPAYKLGEIEHAVEVAAISVAVGDSPLLGGLMRMVDLDEPIDEIEPGDEPVEPDPNADAVLVFSSGTTGMPKAVRHTHASFGTAVRHWRAALNLTAADRIQVVTPPSHIVMTALETGARVRLHRRFDLDTMLKCIARDRITIEMVVAPIALAIADHADLEKYDLSSLRYIMWGATPVTPSVAETITRRTGVRWVPAYGASELPVITCNPIDGARLDSVGRAVPGVRLRVVSLETGQSVGAGETGELQARSASLMAGYLPSEAMAEALQDNWYRTGDVGSIDSDGWVTLTDRLKEMIKVKGFQVAPAEIEAVLHGHPAVQDCAVFGIPDPATGEAIVAAVSAAGPVDAAELIESVAERLASYKRPNEVVFVPHIPRLPSGKVLRRVLKERYGRTTDQ